MENAKLTKGQKNELRRQEYQKRVDAIKDYGYTISERRLGPKGHVDSYSYYLNKDGVCASGVLFRLSRISIN